MSHDQVSLSSAVRSSLLSLQDTSKLIARTEGRLSTGLRVASPVDDPVAFFQAKALSDRAFDFQERKDGIDQGVSTIMAAMNGVEAVEHIALQMKGLTQAMKSATESQFTDLVRQFNDLRSQINRLTADTTYQGVNLINGTGQVLDVEFSEKTDSLLRVDSLDLTYGGLGIGEAAVAASGDSVIEGFAVSGGISADNATRAALGRPGSYRIQRITGATEIPFGVDFTYQGPDDVFTNGGSFDFTYGTSTYQILARADVTLTQGAEISVAMVTAVNGPAATGISSHNDRFGNSAHVAEEGLVFLIASRAIVDTAVSALEYLEPHAAASPNYVTEGNVDAINAVLDEMDAALTTLRGKAAMLGSNVALLKTRLEFTEDYVNTLEGGSGKLTLADINEEGANLLALQTRQQLGISALAFAGQAEQSILALFN